ncbi:MAG: hypothetical protein AB8G96_11675 [Phycisphaerales bacterium]
MPRRPVLGMICLVLAGASGLGAWQWPNGRPISSTIHETVEHTVSARPSTGDWSGTMFLVRGVSGDIVIEGDASADSVRVHAIRQGEGRGRAEARASIDAPAPSLRWTDERTVLLTAAALPADPATDWRIVLPVRMALNVRTDAATVTVRDVAGSVDVESEIGDVRVTAAGKIAARSGAGRVWVNGVECTPGIGGG